MDFKEVIDKLRYGLSKPLPGNDAHKKASPLRRRSTEEYVSENPAFKSSSVTILLFPDNNVTRLLLMERADRGNFHAGQVCFPGGKREFDDQSLLETALRETYEEVGIDPAAINIIGQLSDLYIPASNYLVHPFVGYTTGIPQVKIHDLEVKRILLPDLEDFMMDEMPVDNFETITFGMLEAPYYPFELYKIWGATAMMIKELTEIIKKS